MHFLAAYGGQSIVNPNSGKSDSLFALVCIFLIYLLWSKGMSKKGKPIPRTVLCLVISGFLLIYALLFTNILCLNISISLCAITIYRIINSFKAKQSGVEVPVYYPLYWTSFIIYFILYNFIASGLIESFLRALYEFKSGGILLYILICIPGLIISYIITSLLFLPYLTAEKQNLPYKRTIYLLNIFTGWTVFGWVAILVWTHMPHKVNVRNRSKHSVSDEILKYKQLLDTGAISEEEYQHKKKELLDL